MSSIQKVGVVGCGLMGSGIAQVAAQSGRKTVVREVNDDFLKKGLSRIESFLAKAVEKGKMPAAEKEKVLGNLQGTTDLKAFADCDIVIEAVVENLDEKRKLFSELDRICKPSCLFSSNTSSLAIADMAAATKRPDKFVGLHFFNPVPIMKLVEVVKAIGTSDETVAAAKAFGESLGKSPIVARDTPGFVVNLLLVPFLLDAIRAYESGVATKEDIDQGMVLGCGHPMGPLTLLDFVGLDTTLYIADIMWKEFADARYAAPPLLRRMVAAGHHGKKSGRGFYDYAPAGK